MPAEDRTACSNGLSCALRCFCYFPAPCISPGCLIGALGALGLLLGKVTNPDGSRVTPCEFEKYAEDKAYGCLETPVQASCLPCCTRPSGFRRF